MFEIPFNLPGFALQSVFENETQLLITARATNPLAYCPKCGQASSNVHSYYTRRPKDLPVSDKSAQLVLKVRRFRCNNLACTQRTFGERLPQLLPVYSQRTARLTTTLRAVGFSLSAQAGARLLELLKIPVSPDTLLRLIKQTVLPSPTIPRVLGLDDFSFKKGHSYGTLLVDLERHKPIDLLAQRDAETVSQWLSQHSTIEIISRDRSTEYIRAITLTLPGAIQVADRWHLIKNLREALERASGAIYSQLVKRYKASLGGSEKIPYKRPLKAAEQLSSEASLARRQANYEAVLALVEQGLNQLQIARFLKLNRETVRTYLREGAPQKIEHRPHPSALDPYKPYLQQRWEEGCRNASQLWREIRAQGYGGQRVQVGRWMQVRREVPAPTGPKAKKALAGSNSKHQARVDLLQKEPPVIEEAGEGEEQALQEHPLVRLARAHRTRLPSARALSWLLIAEPSGLSAEQVTLLSFLKEETTLAHTYKLARQFLTMLKKRDVAPLDDWLEECATSGIKALQSFANGLKQDYAAVKAGLSLDISNAQLEGQVNRLKLIKRQMYGRGSFELLRQRVLWAA